MLSSIEPKLSQCWGLLPSCLGFGNHKKPEDCLLRPDLHHITEPSVGQRITGLSGTHSKTITYQELVNWIFFPRPPTSSTPSGDKVSQLSTYNNKHTMQTSACSPESKSFTNVLTVI